MDMSECQLGEVNNWRETCGGIPVQLALLLRFVEKTEHGGNEGDSIAEQPVDPVQLLQATCIVSSEEDKIDVRCHC